MTTTVDVAADQPTITMSRIYDAPRERVWEAITEPKHVRLWWGGAGVTNPVCEMDLRPGGRWTHVMRFPDGREIRMKFVFVDITPPERLVWEQDEPGEHGDGPPACRFTVTLEALGRRTGWHMVAQFRTLSERDAAVAMGFSGPITASNDRFDAYLKTVGGKRMKISMHTLASDSFVAGLESLGKLLDKGAAFSKDNSTDLINARLAPDMFPLAQQVQFVCYNAKDGVSRLTGRGAAPMGQPRASFEEFHADIEDAIGFVRATPASAYEGAEERDCSIRPQEARIVIRMDGLLFLRGWALPHFYFHLVTAYDIMRHKGVVLGKPDFVSWIGPHVEPLK